MHKKEVRIMKIVKVVIHMIIFYFVPFSTFGNLDMKYKVVVNKDGSGRLEIYKAYEEWLWLTLKEDTMQLCKQELKPKYVSKVNLVSYKKRTEDGEKIVEYAYTFEDITALCKFYPGLLIAGKKGGPCAFAWVYESQKPIGTDAGFMKALEDLCEGHYCIFYIEMPTKILKVNERGRILKDKRRAYWRFSMFRWMSGTDLKAGGQFNDFGVEYYMLTK